MFQLSEDEREAYRNDKGKLALALRRMGGEVLRLEFETGYYVNDFGTDTEFCIHDTHVVNLTPCTDPRHDYKRADWEREADRVIREGR